MTGVPEQREATVHDSPRPFYGAEPVHPHRPVPVRHSPEAPSDPAEWDSSSIEPSQPRATDDVNEEQRRAERDTRGDLAAASDDAGGDDDARTDDESSYSSEREQGAAQPGTDDGAGTDDNEGAS